MKNCQHTLHGNEWMLDERCAGFRYVIRSPVPPPCLRPASANVQCVRNSRARTLDIVDLIKHKFCWWQMLTKSTVAFAFFQLMRINLITNHRCAFAAVIKRNLNTFKVSLTLTWTRLVFGLNACLVVRSFLFCGRAWRMTARLQCSRDNDSDALCAWLRSTVVSNWKWFQTWMLHV